MSTEKHRHEEGLDITQMNALRLKKVEKKRLCEVELKNENEKIREEMINLKN